MFRFCAFAIKSCKCHQKKWRDSTFFISESTLDFLSSFHCELVLGWRVDSWIILLYLDPLSNTQVVLIDKTERWEKPQLHLWNNTLKKQTLLKRRWYIYCNNMISKRFTIILECESWIFGSVGSCEYCRRLFSWRTSLFIVVGITMYVYSWTSYKRNVHHH